MGRAERMGARGVGAPKMAGPGLRCGLQGIHRYAGQRQSEKRAGRQRKSGDVQNKTTYNNSKPRWATAGLAMGPRAWVGAVGVSRPAVGRQSRGWAVQPVHVVRGETPQSSSAVGAAKQCRQLGVRARAGWAHGSCTGEGHKGQRESAGRWAAICRCCCDAIMLCCETVSTGPVSVDPSHLLARCRPPRLPVPAQSRRCCCCRLRWGRVGASLAPPAGRQLTATPAGGAAGG